MLRLRDAFNPDGACNPGKLLPLTRTCVESSPAYEGRDYAAAAEKVGI
jgi:hypothetical protein